MSENARSTEMQSAAEAIPTVLPAVDIVEDEAGITLFADLPGVTRDRLGVKVTGDNLLIEGEAAVPIAENVELIYAEMRTPYFRRSFTLSRELDASRIEATLRDGVLKVAIPKADQAKPRRIEVRTG